MRLAITLFAVSALLTGCIGSPVRQADVAHFDLGPAMGDGAAPPGLAAVEVSAPSWLAGGAMQYRLLYGEPTRRFDYADSRWVAPPFELLGQVLERRLVGSVAGHCRLHIELDELVQAFATPQSSHVVLAGRATLLGSPEVLARRSFSLTSVAPTADAKGGVAAAALAVKTLGDELAAWIAPVESCR